MNRFVKTIALVTAIVHLLTIPSYAQGYSAPEVLRNTMTAQIRPGMSQKTFEERMQSFLIQEKTMQEPTLTDLLMTLETQLAFLAQLRAGDLLEYDAEKEGDVSKKIDSLLMAISHEIIEKKVETSYDVVGLLNRVDEHMPMLQDNDEISSSMSVLRKLFLTAVIVCMPYLLMAQDMYGQTGELSYRKTVAVVLLVIMGIIFGGWIIVPVLGAIVGKTIQEVIIKPCVFIYKSSLDFINAFVLNPIRGWWGLEKVEKGIAKQQAYNRSMKSEYTVSEKSGHFYIKAYYERTVRILSKQKNPLVAFHTIGEPALYVLVKAVSRKVITQDALDLYFHDMEAGRLSFEKLDTVLDGCRLIAGLTRSDAMRTFLVEEVLTNRKLREKLLGDAKQTVSIPSVSAKDDVYRIPRGYAETLEARVKENKARERREQVERIRERNRVYLDHQALQAA